MASAAVGGQQAAPAPADGGQQAAPAPAHGGQQGAPVPADGGQPSSTPSIIPLWDPEYSKADVDILRRSPLWGDLASWVKQSLEVHPRQTVSSHTTTF